MSGDQLVGVIAVLAMLLLVFNGPVMRRMTRGTAVWMSLLWFGLFGLVALIFLILGHYGIVDLT